jgi:hypothetical protein
METRFQNSVDALYNLWAMQVDSQKQQVNKIMNIIRQKCSLELWTNIYEEPWQNWYIAAKKMVLYLLL